MGHSRLSPRIDYKQKKQQNPCGSHYQTLQGQKGQIQFKAFDDKINWIGDSKQLEVSVAIWQVIRYKTLPRPMLTYQSGWSKKHNEQKPIASIVQEEINIINIGKQYHVGIRIPAMKTYTQHILHRYTITELSGMICILLPKS